MELLALLLISVIIFKAMNEQYRKMGITYLNPLSRIFSFLTQPPLKDDGMLNKQDEIKIFSKFNDGLLLDGKTKRLSQKNSFSHLALFSRTGGGKTTTYVIPNIFTLAQQNCSMVITDLSGEIYNKTSAYLDSKGYKIHILDPENLNESLRYNPLVYAKDSQSVDTVSEILIASSGVESNEKIWSDGAKTIISVLIKVLNDTGDVRYMNLANVKYMINHFGDKGSGVKEFVQRYADKKTYSEFIGLVNGNDKTLQSFLSTASIALSPIGINDNLEKLTYSHSIDFSKVREEKSVIFIRVKEQEQKKYSFLLNLFYSQFFYSMMKELPKKNDLAIYCLLDEFGNMNIPNFATIVTTIRKYNVSISIILQNMTQLYSRYSKDDAKSILDGGIANKLIYSGADLELAKELSEMFGEKEVIKRDVDYKPSYEKNKL